MSNPWLNQLWAAITLKKYPSAIASLLSKLVVFFSIAFISSCGDYGRELKFNQGQLFYTSTVSESEAQKLGQYLIQQGFFDGKEKSIQLNKSGDIYQFRMVIKKGYEQDPNFINFAKQISQELSKDVFNDAPVEIHLCNQNLQTLKTIGPISHLGDGEMGR